MLRCVTIVKARSRSSVCVSQHYTSINTSVWNGLAPGVAGAALTLISQGFALLSCRWAWHRNQLDAQCPLLRQLAEIWENVGVCRKAWPHSCAKLFIIQQMVILLFSHLHTATLQWSMDAATVSLHQIETSEKLCCEAALAWTENYSCMFISLAFFWWYLICVGAVSLTALGCTFCWTPGSLSVPCYSEKSGNLWNTFQGQRRWKNLLHLFILMKPCVLMLQTSAAFPCHSYSGFSGCLLQLL